MACIVLQYLARFQLRTMSVNVPHAGGQLLVGTLWVAVSSRYYRPSSNRALICPPPAVSQAQLSGYESVKDRAQVVGRYHV